MSHRERGKKLKLKVVHQRGERGGGVDDVKEEGRMKLDQRSVDQVDARVVK